MPGFPSTAPVLSTPDSHIFEDDPSRTATSSRSPDSNADFAIKYEISRTTSEIRAGGWTRVALQFPDSLIADAPRVVESLQQALEVESRRPQENDAHPKDDQLKLESSLNEVSLSETKALPGRLYILGDTSYGACCVDEIAAEHIDADVVVHYGRACLSPTARLPVIYVFTKQPLDYEPLVLAFKDAYQDRDVKILLVSDLTYSSHIPALNSRLVSEGYTSIFAPDIRHDPSSPFPNRTVPPDVLLEPSKLQSWQLFHISDPPPALLLTLSSRVAGIRIYPTASTSISPQATLASTTQSLRRRYALLTSLSTCAIFGILVNTLSVANYLPAISQIQKQLANAGKKSYLFVVGKVNAAKIANFAEIGGWVVVGCWESSLVEGEGFWRPVITPFELEVLLRGDAKRVWTGEWRGDFGGVFEGKEGNVELEAGGGSQDGREGESGEVDSEEESTPPEFDLRTGRYVSHTRPMATRVSAAAGSGSRNGEVGDKSLIKRANGDLAVIGNQVSPGAEFLRSKRTWRGLGSDLEIAYDDSGHEAGTAIEEGRSGIARGYANEDATMNR